MKLFEIRDILEADVLTGDDELDKTIFAAGGSDLMDDVLNCVTNETVLLTGLATDEVIRAAKIAGIAAIVFVRGKKPRQSTVELARSCNLPVLMTRCSLFMASGRLYINGLRGLDGFW